MDEAAKYLKEKETHVAFVLDESGSLGGSEDMIISGFNEQLNVLREQRKDGGEVTVSMYKFGSRPDSRPRVIFKTKDVRKVRDLSNQNYAPFGNTPMYDGIGMALSDLTQLDKDDGVDRAFLVVVFTDGYENASKEWDGTQLAERIQQLQDRGNWTVSFIGANVDLRQDVSTQFVPFSNVGSFGDVGTAVNAGTVALSSYMTSRGMGATQTANYLDESVTDDGFQQE